MTGEKFCEVESAELLLDDINFFFDGCSNLIRQGGIGECQVSSINVMGKKITHHHLLNDAIRSGCIANPEKPEAQVSNDFSVAGPIFLVLLEEFFQVHRKRLLE
jgi:hypothetical protein